MEFQDNILGLIGNTPLVRLNRLARNVKAQIFAKMENLNPGYSVKDRIGVSMIEAAEREGILKPGGTVVEATSGNTGIGLAIAAAVKGYKCIFVMTDKASVEKSRYLKALGADVVITPVSAKPGTPDHYVSTARRIASRSRSEFDASDRDGVDGACETMEARMSAVSQTMLHQLVDDIKAVWDGHRDNTGGRCRIDLDGHDCCYLCNRVEAALRAYNEERNG